MRNLFSVQVCEIDDGILSITEEERSVLDLPFRRKNFFVLLGITFFIFSLFFGRIVYLALFRGEEYAQAAYGNAIRNIPIEAPRGRIFDRRGRQLVYNVPSSNLVFYTAPGIATLDKSDFKHRIAFMNIPEENIDIAFERVQESYYTEVILKENLTQEEILRFIEVEKDFPYLSLKKSIIRKYEDSTIFSHIIGYESLLTQEDRDIYLEYYLTDSVGRQGVEKEYEEYLRGKYGFDRVQVDAFGNIQKKISSQSPIAGNDIILSIDAELQEVLYDSVKDEMESAGLSRAAAVALHPQSGEILALVSLPSYDNNIFSQRDNSLYSIITKNSHQPLFNRVISGEYPPASTIKPFIATAALEEGVVTASTRIESQGGITVGDTFFGDWKTHGFTDVQEAIAVSSDVYFYSIGGGYGGTKGMGMDTMKEYEERFGFGSKTGIDLPGEKPGFIPDPEWKKETLGERWYVGNTYHASIGQGYMKATPLQVTVGTAVIANRGTLFDPKVVSHIQSTNSDIVYRPDYRHREVAIQDSVIDIVREGMRKTVTEGTALMLNDLSVEVAGKTGTAQYGPEDKTHGWFTSFAPYDDPEIVLTVLVESQENDGYHAVPITKRVYEAYFDE